MPSSNSALRMTVAIAVVVAGSLLVATQGNADPGPQPEELLSVLTSLQGGEDVLPDYLTAGFRNSGQIFDNLSVRLLFESNDQRHWAAIDETGQICHIVEYLGEKESHNAMAACATVQEFAEKGIASVLETSLGGVRAVLVPDGFLGSLKSQIAAQYPTDENLAIFPFDSSNAEEKVLLQTLDGRSLLIVLPPGPDA